MDYNSSFVGAFSIETFCFSISMVKFCSVLKRINHRINCVPKFVAHRRTYVLNDKYIAFFAIVASATALSNSNLYFLIHLITSINKDFSTSSTYTLLQLYMNFHIIVPLCTKQHSQPPSSTVKMNGLCPPLISASVPAHLADERANAANAFILAYHDIPLYLPVSLDIALENSGAIWAQKQQNKYYSYYRRLLPLSSITLNRRGEVMRENRRSP